VPIIATTCKGSNDDPSGTVSSEDAANAVGLILGACPQCRTLQRVYKDREGRLSIMPHVVPQ
jgi:hypothetical protein